MQPFALEVYQNRETSYHPQAEVNVIFMLMISLKSHNWFPIPEDALKGVRL
jgi:hypothetical protein